MKKLFQAWGPGIDLLPEPGMAGSNSNKNGIDLDDIFREKVKFIC
jgi:hypothetical protein